ncbi:SIR2 family protein [Clostridium sporogenes]|uniref:SIR2 family protein n=1 Tax=Clostridium sporogenes TaxID=1509 RepID=UPI00223913D8|nr:SIR2 family protein [Clostridium sporogenes]MCW6110138.1 SIR2 family protein [Clostridium sporogenes]
MNLDEKIRYIKKAKDENRLVIFVGAGVSKNSDLPDWSELVKEFVNRLNYPISKDKELSSDEYLKIPQYYYNIHGRENYERVIKEVLDIERESNEIHELIFRLNPKHIITTNYDRLLENTMIEQRMIFDVISKDKDLLDSNKSNYIIKMHGDIKALDNIVLKENDYLNYSQNHILIETFIKSLLVSNTFLFVGYSLNDYNLKQIISWVDYLAKGYTDINDRPKNFIIQEVDKNYMGFIEDYYEKNNIFIIDPNEINEEYSNNLEGTLSNEFGKRLYNTLMYIKDYPNTIIDKLYYGYMRFKKCKRVSIYDLFKIYKFKYATFLKGNTLWFPSIEENEYLVIKDLVNGKAEKEKFIKEILIKSGIVYVQIDKDDKQEYYSLLEDSNTLQNKYSDLTKLEIKCDYLEIDKRINSIEDKYIKAYYLFKLQRFNEAKECLEYLNQEFLNRDIYDLLLYKFNLGLLYQLIYHDDKGNYDDFRYIYNNIAKNTMYELNYLNNIFNNNNEQLLELEKLKNKHIKKYLKLDNSVQLCGDIRYDLFSIITISYDYYFYIKDNGIFLDYFTNMKTFFAPFIEAILSTYSPKTKRVRTETFLPDYNKYEKYILNKYDLDIIIKYSKYKQLQGYLNEYEVNELRLEEDIDIVEILCNLCQYIKLKPNRFNIEYLKTFILILSVINLSVDDVSGIVKVLEDILINNEGDLHLYIFTEINTELNKLLNKNSKLITKNSFRVIINELFTDKVYKHLKEQSKTSTIFNFLSCTKTFSYDICKDEISNKISENNLDYILGLHNQLTEVQEEKARDNILKIIDTININTIIQLICYNIIEYDKVIEKRIIDNLNLYVSEREKNPSFRCSPDPIQSTLGNVVLLFLLQKGVCIEEFEKYVKYYDVLEFIINPCNFDYEKIALDHYNWMNIMNNEEYLRIIIDKAKDIMNTKLRYIIDNGFANKKQTRLYYKYFEIEDK